MRKDGAARGARPEMRQVSSRRYARSGGRKRSRACVSPWRSAEQPELRARRGPGLSSARKNALSWGSRVGAGDSKPVRVRLCCLIRPCAPTARSERAGAAPMLAGESVRRERWANVSRNAPFIPPDSGSEPCRPGLQIHRSWHPASIYAA